MHKEIEVNIRTLPLVADDFYRLAHNFHRERNFVFLDSRLAQSRFSRCSYLSFEPFAVARVLGLSTSVEWRAGQVDVLRGNAFDSLRRLLGPFQADPNRLPPKAREYFIGGAAGYLSYQLRHQVEDLPSRAVDDMGIPHAVVGLFNFSVILNQRENQVLLAHFHPGVECAYPDVHTLEAALLKAAKQNIEPVEAGRLVEPAGCCVASLSRMSYLDAVRRIKEYILAGDIYQANFSQRFSVRLAEHSPWRLYCNLMRLNPAPFAAYLDFNDLQVLSSSPERFLQVDGRRVETRPIKGTIRRGSCPEEDRELRAWLYKSEKNRAELAMIVDLMRNDIGRVCEFGSVRVLAFPEIETYSSVHHLVSTVEGWLKEGKDIFDLLQATFPGGSITGAPKIRSMEIIDELEPVERGVYTGCIGYIGVNGLTDLNIAIRTIVLANRMAYLNAGGGIVMDSDPEDEYAESLLKARNLLLAIGAGKPTSVEINHDHLAEWRVGRRGPNQD
jgi:para-aminobenzoate synthetase component 1